MSHHIPSQEFVRNPLAFTRRPRMQQSTPEWDLQEVQWWDSNAGHIERVWGMPEPLCRAARQGYIEDIRDRFLELGAERPLRILEIACGSGWPGRLLASPEVKVTGMDFSEGQIQMARAKAAQAGQTNCDYIQMDINQMDEAFKPGRFDGAFIHCGIHHLSAAELTNFVKLLSRSEKGFPAILVEPVYLDRDQPIGHFLGKLTNVLYALLQRLYLARPIQDEAVVHTNDALVKLASTKGWFFSPKEVPFDSDEIRRLFSANFDIVEIVPVTRFGLSAAQYLATLKDQGRARQMADRVLPILTSIDRMLIKTGLLSLLTSDFLVSRITLIRK